MATQLEFLVDELDGDLASRKREISDLRQLTTQASGARQDLLARSCQVMTYAHWEGFTKFALGRYLEFICSRQLPVGSLKPGLQALALRGRVHGIDRERRDVSEMIGLISHFDARSTDIFSVDSSRLLRFGNLDTSGLSSVLSCLGLAYKSVYATRQNFIDEVLCGRRHRIAHGEWQPIQIHEAIQVTHDTLMLCDELNTQIQEAAVYELYKI
ncbi:MAE_28990/MAE_18760 family HEPN-like nuclease [Demequina sp. NBRC 110057]|uniref:MAE_28990/MAE_18760 family HEPN-like nuclease n=1 Tax=Demequina sp. NBRC 110057 TaxID=1570346 RepID=UPI0013564137